MTDQVPQGIDGGGADLYGDSSNDQGTSPRVVEDRVESEDEELQLAIEQQMALVNPVLDGLFKAEALNDDYWLKKKSVKHLVHWIKSILDVANIQEQKITALMDIVGAQEAELEELRPAKGKIWTPKIG